MAKTGNNNSIEVNRGNILVMNVTTNKPDGSPYIFQPGDVLRFNVMERNNCNNIVLQKDFTVETESADVQIVAFSDEMKFGPIINKPVDYWYEIELNPDTPGTVTIIGYDTATGPKILTLTPEGGNKA